MDFGQNRTVLFSQVHKALKNDDVHLLEEVNIEKVPAGSLIFIFNHIFNIKRPELMSLLQTDFFSNMMTKIFDHIDNHYNTPSNCRDILEKVFPGDKTVDDFNVPKKSKFIENVKILVNYTFILTTLQVVYIRDRANNIIADLDKPTIKSANKT